MGKHPFILRCRCARCVIERRNRFFVILLVCTALATISKLLVDEHAYFRATDLTSSNSVSEKIAHGGFQYSAGDRSPENAGPGTSCSFVNSYSSEAKHSLLDSCLSRERFNAALAAGLISEGRDFELFGAYDFDEEKTIFLHRLTEMSDQIRRPEDDPTGQARTPFFQLTTPLPERVATTPVPWRR